MTNKTAADMDVFKATVPLPAKLTQELIGLWNIVFDGEFDISPDVLAGAEVNFNDYTSYSMRKGDTLVGTSHLTLSRSNPELEFWAR